MERWAAFRLALVGAMIGGLLGPDAQSSGSASESRARGDVERSLALPRGSCLRPEVQADNLCVQLLRVVTVEWIDRMQIALLFAATDGDLDRALAKWNDSADGAPRLTGRGGDYYFISAQKIEAKVGEPPIEKVLMGPIDRRWNGFVLVFTISSDEFHLGGHELKFGGGKSIRFQVPDGSADKV